MEELSEFDPDSASSTDDEVAVKKLRQRARFASVDTMLRYIPTERGELKAFFPESIKIRHQLPSKDQTRDLRQELHKTVKEARRLLVQSCRMYEGLNYLKTQRKELLADEACYIMNRIQTEGDYMKYAYTVFTYQLTFD